MAQSNKMNNAQSSRRSHISLEEKALNIQCQWQEAVALHKYKADNDTMQGILYAFSAQNAEMNGYVQ